MRHRPRAGLVLFVFLLSFVIAFGALPAQPAEATVSRGLELKALKLAAAQKGKPYRRGAVGPRAFDCSGLIVYIYRTRLHHHLPRTSAAQLRAVHRVARSKVRPGDLIFFTSHGRAYHVGIYAGKGRIWHAPRSGQRVRKEKIWTSHWVAGRVR